MADRSDAEQRLELIAYLKSLGFSDEQLAANENRLFTLASRRVLFGDEERVTVAEIAAMAGCEESLVRKVRLAAGLREAGLLGSFVLGAELLGDDVLLQFTRVLGSATAGLAEAAIATFASNRQAQ